ncbi:MAG: helix-turn-helix transcriptional regulator [Blastocatellia bacterium]|nr:helix-turn-helix transcriptional regulator [Blastocatellia bacterium]
MSQKVTRCPAETTLNFIGGRWKIPILWRLFSGVKRFSELMRDLKGITQKMLTQQLREMEQDGLIYRQVYAQVPPKVEYSLTPLGESLKPVVYTMIEWGKSQGAICPLSEGKKDELVSQVV